LRVHDITHQNHSKKLKFKALSFSIHNGKQTLYAISFHYNMSNLLYYIKEDY
jgi:hypothetical protein